MTTLKTVPNRDLEIIEGNKARWNQADERRYAFHNLHRIARYSLTFRSARTLCPEKRMNLRMADFEPLRHFTSLPWFSAMVVIRGPYILFERYASDFGPHQPHSIQSISKTMINLIIGRLVETHGLDLSKPVRDYLPEVGSGYAEATLQQVLNMDVVNEYSEDFADPQATYYRHEEAMGWRLPVEPAHEEMQRPFLARIKSDSTVNRSGRMQYKDANTDILGWVAERVSTRPLRAFLADIVDAAGLEGCLHITTDREGVPSMDGGASLTARDLARYFSIFVREGRGVCGESVGSGAFIAQTLQGGIAMDHPYDNMRYSNHLMVSEQALGHGGWGGQYVLANPQTQTVAAFLSVIETQHAINRDYLGPVIRMLEAVAGPEFLDSP